METPNLFSFPEVPKGIKLVTWATSLRWFGWGFVETLVPIFLFSFNHNYADTGILRSIYGIVFILILPFVAWLANRVSSKYLLIAALLMYPFISLSYFFAGGFGLVALIVLARALNGAAYALDSVGRDTYIRSHTNDTNIARSFGYFDTLTNFWWLIAVAISIVLVKWIRRRSTEKKILCHFCHHIRSFFKPFFNGMADYFI
jgi:MFS family permease